MDWIAGHICIMNMGGRWSMEESVQVSLVSPRQQPIRNV